MPRRALALLCLTGASFGMGCDGGAKTEARADVPMTAPAIVVTAPPPGVPGVVPAAPAPEGRIAGPRQEGAISGMEYPEDPLSTLFDPTAPRVVTLALVAPAAAARKGRPTPSMTLFGGADQAWRVQVGPRMDLGRKSGLMLRGGTQGQHNRWDVGASATVGEQSNVQGIVRFRP